MTAMIEFDRVSIVFGGEPGAGAAADGRGQDPGGDPEGDRAGPRRARLLADGRAGRDLGADGAVRLGQVDAAARRQRPEPGGARPGAGARHRRRDGRRRHLRRREPARRCGAARSRWCSSSSRCCPGAAWSRTSRSGSSSPASRKEERLAKAREVLATVNLQRLGREEGLRALGRHAAARRPGAGLRDRRRDPADGRAVLGARPADPQPAAGRAPDAAGEDALHDRLRQPRPRGGGEARQHHHHHGGRPHRADRRGPRTSCCGRPTATSPTSSPT